MANKVINKYIKFKYSYVTESGKRKFALHEVTSENKIKELIELWGGSHKFTRIVEIVERTEFEPDEEDLAEVRRGTGCYFCSKTGRVLYSPNW